MRLLRSRRAVRPLVLLMVLAVMLPLVHSHALFESSGPDSAHGPLSWCAACAPNGRLAVLPVLLSVPLIRPTDTLTASTLPVTGDPVSREMPARAPPACV